MNCDHLPHADALSRTPMNETTTVTTHPAVTQSGGSGPIGEVGRVAGFWVGLGLAVMNRWWRVRRLQDRYRGSGRQGLSLGRATCTRSRQQPLPWVSWWLSLLFG